MTSPSDVPARIARQWLEFARNDLAWAERGASDPSLPGNAQVGFHAQQAVEKMLKGLLTTYGVEPEEQHNLGRLVSQLHKLDRTTAEAISDVGTLTPFAVIHRYPPRMPSGFSGPSREDAVEAVKIARKACQVLESAVALRIAPDFRQSPESEAQ